MHDEKDLLARIKNADHAAYRRLFERYVEKIYHYIYGYVKNRQQAEDLTQEVFKRLWEKRSLLNENRSLSGLLFTLCYHQIIDHFRSNSIRYLDSTADEDLLPDQSEADHKIRYGQLESLYHQAINQLPPKRKEVYLLSRHEGLSNKEIAKRLHISVKTVENQMTSTLQFIRNFFNRAGHFILVLILSRW